MYLNFTLLLLSLQCNTLHGTEYNHLRLVSVCVCVCVCVCAQVLGPNISKTVRERDSVTMRH